MFCALASARTRVCMCFPLLFFFAKFLFDFRDLQRIFSVPRFPFTFISASDVFFLHFRLLSALEPKVQPEMREKEDQTAS